MFGAQSFSHKVKTLREKWHKMGVVPENAAWYHGGAMPMVSNGRIRILALVLATGLGGSPVAPGQNFSLEVAQADQVLSEGILPESLLETLTPLEEGYKGEFRIHLGGTAAYNSNLFIDSTNEQDDVILGLTPAITYTSDPEGGAPFVLTAFYAPSLLFYLDHSNLNRINHSGGVQLTMTGAVTSARIFADFTQNSGGDRFTGGFSNSSVLRFGVEATRQIAPRTSLFARLTASASSYSGTTKTGTNTFRPKPDGTTFYSAEIGGAWLATERLDIGPSLRYSVSNSDTSGTHTSIGLLVNASYQWTDHIDLKASIGPSFYDSSRIGGDSGTNLDVNFYADYQINELWSTRAGIRYDMVPSPGARNYSVANYEFSASIVRHLQYGTIETGATYNISDYQASGLTPVAIDDQDFWTAFLSYRRNFTASERLRFNATLQYGNNSGRRDWSQWLFTTGLDVPS